MKCQPRNGPAPRLDGTESTLEGPRVIDSTICFSKDISRSTCSQSKEIPGLEYSIPSMRQVYGLFATAATNNDLLTKVWVFEVGRLETSRRLLACNWAKENLLKIRWVATSVSHNSRTRIVVEKKLRLTNKRTKERKRVFISQSPLGSIRIQRRYRRVDLRQAFVSTFRANVFFQYQCESKTMLLIPMIVERPQSAIIPQLTSQSVGKGERKET